MTNDLLKSYSERLITPVEEKIGNKSYFGRANFDQMHMLSDSLHVYSVDVHFGNKYLIKGFLDCPNAKESVCTCGKQHLHRVFIVGARRSVMRDMGHTRYLNLGSVCITFLDSKNLGRRSSHLDESLRDAQKKHGQMATPASRAQINKIRYLVQGRVTTTLNDHAIHCSKMERSKYTGIMESQTI